MRMWSFLLVGFFVLAAIAWTSDSVTMQGERTVYTVECRQGSWQGPRCGGQLAASDRVRFRALKAHREVLFWTVGDSEEPSGKFTDCLIEDGRHWRCKLSPDAPRTITHEMLHGRPVADPAAAKPFHAVAKWRWWLLHWGLPVGSEADD